MVKCETNQALGILSRCTPFISVESVWIREKNTFKLVRPDLNFIFFEVTELIPAIPVNQHWKRETAEYFLNRQR